MRKTRSRFWVAWVSAVLWVLSAGFLASAEKAELTDLMKENGKAFSAIEKGIAKGKFEGLAEKAQGMVDRAALVAKEYEPPVNKEQMDKFRAFSIQLGEEARRLKGSLEKSDPAESKKLLKNLEKTCISCHKTFVPKKKK